MSSGEKPRGRNVPLSPSGGPVKFGPFMLESRLAVGGTAEVYLARPIDPTAEPARLVVKRLLPHFLADPEGRTMFAREAALHGAVHHENVVEVLGFGVERDEPWIAMEYVEGCDLFRLLRRLGGQGRRLPAGVAVYVAREMLRALESVHSARDANGHPLGIIHRDVTPSNVYLSMEGGVMLGDFGIARSTGRMTQRTAAGAMLKGKFAYLAPEQVAGDPFDQRADLFATAAVLAEMFLGEPLFGGSGQLAVLLAIRDCRIDCLRGAAGKVPPGVLPVLERALTRDPASRVPNAAAFLADLAAFEANPEAMKSELAAIVRWVQTAPSVAQMQAVRDSAAKMRASPLLASASAPEKEPIRAQNAIANSPAADEPPADEDDLLTDAEADRRTGEYGAAPSTVITAAKARLGPWSFARLVEAIATGQVSRGDRVDYMGRGERALEVIEELARFLPAVAAASPGAPSAKDPELAIGGSQATLVATLLRVLATDATGVLVAEATGETAGKQATLRLSDARKELYFVAGKLQHVASNNASELLGEYLVRRSMISREELDFALAVLPRYGGRMGDTLIALGLVGSIEIFRAIRDQGRDRVIDVFRWKSGKISYFAGRTSPHADFPLELDLPALIVAGAEAAASTEAPLARWRERLGTLVSRGPGNSEKLRQAPWPAVARQLLQTLDAPKPLRDVLSATTKEGSVTANEVLIALDVLLAADLVRLS